MEIGKLSKISGDHSHNLGKCPALGLLQLGASPAWGRWHCLGVLLSRSDEGTALLEARGYRPLSKGRLQTVMSSKADILLARAMPSKGVQRSTPGDRSLTFVHTDSKGTYSTWCWESWLCPWQWSSWVSAPSLQRVHHHLCWGDSQAPCSPSQSNRSHRTRPGWRGRRGPGPQEPSWWVPLSHSWSSKECCLQMFHCPEETFPKLCGHQKSPLLWEINKTLFPVLGVYSHWRSLKTFTVSGFLDMKLSLSLIGQDNIVHLRGHSTE